MGKSVYSLIYTTVKLISYTPLALFENNHIIINYN